MSEPWTGPRPFETALVENATIVLLEGGTLRDIEFRNSRIDLVGPNATIINCQFDEATVIRYHGRPDGEL